MSPRLVFLRRLAPIALILLVTAPIGAQGWIIPRPCPSPRCPPPRPCELGPCPAPIASAIERTSSDVEVQLRDGVLQYEIVETFVNRGGVVGEADYLFPLPRQAAFRDLKLEIDGELVAGETMGADEARRIYEEIVRSQRDPALVEWMGYGLLRTRIFPIAAGETKKVVVRFDAVAEREGDALRVDYFRGARTAAAPERITGARDRSEGRMSFRLTYPAGRYGEAYSPTHELTERTASGQHRVEVSGDAREMTLLVPLLRGDRPAIAVLSHAPGNEDGFALITLSPPPASAGRRTPRDVTLVLDVSGSMSGRKMEQARAAGRQVLATLADRDRFRIIDFSTDVRTFRDDFVPASRENIAAAERYLAALEAQGSTNISGALQEALAPEPTEGRLPLVLFVTDGEPTVGDRDPAAIAARAERARGRRRIFTFGVGADVNAALIERLAVDGAGTAQFVRPDESVERAVSLVASRLTDPVATDVRVRAEGVRLLKVHPSGPVDLFAGQDLVLFARYDGAGQASIRFEGRNADGPVSWVSEVELPDRDRENAFVTRLWATQRVGWLSAERRRNGSSRELDDELRELGERYGIPTELTSYLVLEPGMVAARQGRPGAQLQPGGVIGAGSGSPAPTAGTSLGAREEQFARAKDAAERRAARSLADVQRLDEGVGNEGSRGVASPRRVASRIFMMRDDSTWIDSRYRETMRVTKIKAYSAAYFALVRELPDVREALSVGDRVIVAGRRVAVEVGPDGLESLGAAELGALRRDW